MADDKLIGVIPTKEFNIGSVRHVPPPPFHKSYGRLQNYRVEFAPSLAKTLVQNSMALPHTGRDQKALEALGVRRGRFPNEEPPEIPERAVAARAQMMKGSVKNQVREALESGRKPDLVKALDAAGIDGSSFTNNEERIAALTSYIESTPD